MDGTAVLEVEKEVKEERAMEEGPPIELKRWPKLSPEAYHGLPSRIVSAIGPHTESDPIALLAQSILAFGSVIGRSAYFRAEADHHFTNLFCVLVGNTSKGRKGTSLGHIRRLFQSIDETWAKERIQSGLSSGEGLIWAVRDEITEQKPIKGQGGIVSGYQDVVVDPGVKDKRLLVVESEFASTLRILGRDGNTLSPCIRNAWDSRPLQTIIKNSPGRCLEPFISILGHITAGELTEYLTRTEAGNGFGNRLLFFVIRRSKCLPDGGRLHKEDLHHVIEEIRTSVEFAQQVGELQRDTEASELWRSVYPSLSEGIPGLTGALTARAEAQTMRLACLYALMDRSSSIKVEHLQAALALWRYSEDSVKFIFGETTGDPAADKLRTGLKKHPDGMTLTEISNEIFLRHKTRTQIASALKNLSATGFLSSRTEKTSGRPKTVYFLTGREKSEKSE